MNKDTFEGNWLQFKGKVQEEWGKLTEQDIDIIAGKRDQLAGRLQERYGMARGAVEKMIARFEKKHFTTTTTSR